MLAVPSAFLGGWLNLPGPWFQRLVAVVLLVSAWRLGSQSHDASELRQPSSALLVAVGGGLGLLAGLTGTGGGVFLTPLLLLCRWCSTHQAAAVGSHLGSRQWPLSWIRRVLAAVLVLASAKLLRLGF